MKHILIGASSFTVQAMYEKANTNHQRALLGYMIKNGYASNDAFCHAFHVLYTIETIESRNGLYNFVAKTDIDKAKAIMHIVEAARRGNYNSFKFSKRDIKKIIRQLERRQ